MKRALDHRFLRQNGHERAQNQNQNKRSNGPNVLGLLQLDRPKQVRAVSISEYRTSTGDGIEVLETGLGVIVRNRDAGEQQERGQENREASPKSQPPAQHARTLPFAPPVTNECHDAQERPHRVQNCVDTRHCLPMDSREQPDDAETDLPPSMVHSLLYTFPFFSRTR